MGDMKKALLSLGLLLWWMLVGWLLSWVFHSDFNETFPIIVAAALAIHIVHPKEKQQ